MVANDQKIKRRKFAIISIRFDGFQETMSGVLKVGGSLEIELSPNIAAIIFDCN